MAWRINKQGGIFKKGAAFALQKRYQIAVSYLRTGSFAAAAAENLCTYDAARKITNKFLMTGLFDPGNRGSPPTIMPPWKVAYLEALVTHNPFMYLCEMQAALRDDLNLPPAEVPSLPTIKGIKSSPGEFYTREQCSTKGFCELATNCRSEEAVFCRWNCYTTHKWSANYWTLPYKCQCFHCHQTRRRARENVCVECDQIQLFTFNHRPRVWNKEFIVNETKLRCKN